MPVLTMFWILSAKSSINGNRWWQQCLMPRRTTYLLFILSPLRHTHSSNKSFWKNFNKTLILIFLAT
ncbi:hypothetical protein BDF20DRAFT_874399 [Mycotypha africana]|uniref:uncharacterized protein n=1 Tax=Mycotypha africana TaxID=64632 RepID=UPI002301344E|nr:uncharacterized protein BDF20DRAFT_874399 [Mycotypha africana]KAI8977370.1 hypothetical protein BDF20DRAFT_874399 [Mycotypha africana]